MEKKTRHYEFEGAVFDIPMYYDELTGVYIEEYRNFNENPVWTADGFPITHAVEDVCPYGEWDHPSRCSDCGSCRFYSHIAEHTRIGVCRQEKNKKKEMIL
ncbi:MAG: hypothetical protein LUD44_07820 [Firmicutes bacterium]|nr:hypothetical protein [Bacillota bacterium]MCD8315520.1 hypothetical protein [Bacillota bacterium]